MEKKKGEIALEELVRLIIFLLSLVVIGIIFSKILIPKIFEKNSEIMCKNYIMLKNDESLLKSFLIGSLASVSCVEVKKEFAISSKEEFLYYLLNYLGKVCEITNSNKKDIEVCLFSLVFKSDKNIKIDSQEIKSLMFAKLPINNEVLMDFCTHQNIYIDENIEIKKFKNKVIKICYSYKNNEGLIEIRTS